MHSHGPPAVPGVTPIEAAELLEHGAIMIDVRERDEWDTERIPGVALKPMSTIDDWYADLPREGTVIVQCRTGSRSGQVVHALMEQAGFENVVNLEGGIVGWKFQGLDTES